MYKIFFRSILILALISLFMFAQADANKYTLYNRSGQDLWIAKGQNKDSSVAGIGSSGHADTNPYLGASGWEKIVSNGSIDLNIHMASHLVVAVAGDRGLRALEPKKCINTDDYQYFPYSEKAFGIKVPYHSPNSKGGRSNSERAEAITKNGYRYAKYYNVDCWQKKWQGNYYNVIDSTTIHEKAQKASPSHSTIPSSGSGAWYGLAYSYKPGQSLWWAIKPGNTKEQALHNAEVACEKNTASCEKKHAFRKGYCAALTYDQPNYKSFWWAVKGSRSEAVHTVQSKCTNCNVLKTVCNN